MGYQRCEAIVLRRTRFSETSLVLTLLTDRYGRVEAIAKGARRPKSPLLGHLDLYALEEMELYVKSRGRLDLVTEASLCEEFYGLRVAEERFLAASVLADTVLAACMERDPHPVSFRILRDAYASLARGDPPIPTLAFAVLKLLDDFGLAPLIETCAACGTALQERTAYTLSGQHGGLLCPLCTGEPGTRPLPPAAVSILHFLARRPPGPLPRMGTARDASLPLLEGILAYARYLLNPPFVAGRRLLQRLAHPAPPLSRQGDPTCATACA